MSELKANTCAKCCMDMNIDPLDLLFPARMTPEGREFVEAHGILNKPLSVIMQHARVLDNGFIELQHRCDQLDPHGLCTIYENRPKICRDYVCSKRKECSTQGVPTVLEFKRGA